MRSFRLFRQSIKGAAFTSGGGTHDALQLVCWTVRDEEGVKK